MPRKGQQAMPKRHPVVRTIWRSNRSRRQAHESPAVTARWRTADTQAPRPPPNVIVRNPTSNSLHGSCTHWQVDSVPQSRPNALGRLPAVDVLVNSAASHDPQSGYARLQMSHCLPKSQQNELSRTTSECAERSELTSLPQTLPNNLPASRHPEEYSQFKRWTNPAMPNMPVQPGEAVAPRYPNAHGLDGTELGHFGTFPANDRGRGAYICPSNEEATATTTEAEGFHLTVNSNVTVSTTYMQRCQFLNDLGYYNRGTNARGGFLGQRMNNRPLGSPMNGWNNGITNAYFEQGALINTTVSATTNITVEGRSASLPRHLHVNPNPERLQARNLAGFPLRYGVGDPQFPGNGGIPMASPRPLFYPTALGGGSSSSTLFSHGPYFNSVHQHNVYGPITCVTVLPVALPPEHYARVLGGNQSYLPVAVPFCLLAPVVLPRGPW